MTEKHKNAIRRGIKRMQRRRNLSAGMKASWARRKASNSTPIATDDVYAVANILLGVDKVKRILSDAIKESL